MREHLIIFALLTAVTLLACGTDITVAGGDGLTTSRRESTTTVGNSMKAPVVTTREGTMTISTGKSTTTAGTDADRKTGVVAVRLEQIQGYFIEGFEIGLRFETAEGDVIASTLWSDFVKSQGSPQLKDYYNSVLEQPVPAGDIVVLATVNIGVGPPPEIPDLDGDLQCRLKVQVPDNGRVEVKISFGDRDNCLQLLD